MILENFNKMPFFDLTGKSPSKSAPKYYHTKPTAVASISLVEEGEARSNRRMRREQVQETIQSNTYTHR